MLANIQLFIRNVAVVKDKIRTVVKGLLNPFYLFGQPDVILIAKEYLIAVSMADGIGKICNDTLVIALNVYYSVVLLHKTANYSFCRLPRIVIRNDDLIRFFQLGKD